MVQLPPARKASNYRKESGARSHGKASSSPGSKRCAQAMLAHQMCCATGMSSSCPPMRGRLRAASPGGTNPWLAPDMPLRAEIGKRLCIVSSTISGCARLQHSVTQLMLFCGVCFRPTSAAPWGYCAEVRSGSEFWVYPTGHPEMADGGASMERPEVWTHAPDVGPLPAFQARPPTEHIAPRAPNATRRARPHVETSRRAALVADAGEVGPVAEHLGERAVRRAGCPWLGGQLDGVGLWVRSKRAASVR